MNPGIYYDIPWDKYRKINAMSPSTLKHGIRSMKRLKRAIDGELVYEGDALKIGNAVHCQIAGEYHDRIVTYPEWEKHPENVTATGKPSTSKATAYYKQAKEAFEAENADRIKLTEVQANIGRKIVRNIYANDEAAEWLAESAHEVTVIGVINDVFCKTRVDLYRPKEQIAGDVKTTTDIESKAFYRQAERFGYLFQFAFHDLIFQANGIQLQSYSVIAAETKDDYDVGVIDIQPWPFDRWTNSVEEVLAKYKQAKRTGKWPGIYGEAGKGILDVPNWAMGSDEMVEWNG